MENPKTNHGDQNALKTWRDYEERTDAENKQIYDDALHDGRRVENGPVMTSGGKEIIHNQITEFVPGASGRLEDMCARLATQITNHDGSIEQITQYYLPGHIVDDVTVRS